MGDLQELWNFMPLGPIFIGVVTVALGALVADLVMGRKHAIDARMFMAMIQKLVAANNIERAMKLCAAAGESAIGQLTRSILMRMGSPHPPTQDVVRNDANRLYAEATRKMWRGRLAAAGAIVCGAAVLVTTNSMAARRWTALWLGVIGLLAVMTTLAAMKLRRNLDVVVGTELRAPGSQSG
jgi:hypothetical protein